MKRIKSLFAVVLTAGLIGCQSAPVQTTVVPIAANQSSRAVVTAAPAADSKRSRTILVLALLAGLIAAAVIISATGDGDGAY
jgi:hypothetical protein